MSRHSLSKAGPGVFVGPRFPGGTDDFQLEVYEAFTPEGTEASIDFQPGPTRRRQRLAHFIAAGGMRQLRRTYAEDVADRHRRQFVVYLMIAFLAWCVFYALPVAS